MLRTEKRLLALHSDITAYAAAKIADYGLPRCDLEDVVSEAYVRAQAKVKRYKTRKSQAELFKTIAWSEVMRELDKRGYIAALHDRYDLRLDAEKPTETDGEGEDELENDGLAISDYGEGAAKIRSFDEPEEPEIPDWAIMFRVLYEKTHNDPRRVLDGFKTTWDSEKVRRKLAYDSEYFYRLVKNLQRRFDQCFRAYHEWQLEKAGKMK